MSGDTKDGGPAELFDLYEVSRSGQVFSIASNWRGYGRREMRKHVHTDGYQVVHLTINGKKKRFRVHKLVALRHLPPKPSPKHEIRHLDGDRLNNHADNLTWGTQKQNADDRERHGRTSRGEKHSKLIKAALVGVERPSPRGRKLNLSEEQREQRRRQASHMRACRMAKIKHRYRHA